METRFRTGEPYIHFIDESNRKLPEPLKKKGLEIKGSNLCAEITLPTNSDRTAVCCLSSLNLEKFDEWKDSTIVEDLIEMLDNVLTQFIDHAPQPALFKATSSALTERSLGLGAMGFHSYLQSKSIPWESAMAVGQNKMMFAYIKQHALKATKDLCKTKSEYMYGFGTGRRNSHLLAIAPNANSGMIIGLSLIHI